MSFLSPNNAKSVSGEQINDPNQFPGLIISSSIIDFRQKGAALLCKSHCQCHYYNSYSYSATLILAVSLQLKKWVCSLKIQQNNDSRLFLSTVCKIYSWPLANCVYKIQLFAWPVCSFLLNKISTNVLLWTQETCLLLTTPGRKSVETTWVGV